MSATTAPDVLGVLISDIQKRSTADGAAFSQDETLAMVVILTKVKAAVERPTGSHWTSTTLYALLLLPLAGVSIGLTLKALAWAGPKMNEIAGWF